MTGNASVNTQHCSSWCPGAKTPGHQYPQCQLNDHCIGPVSYRNITIIEDNIKKLKSQNNNDNNDDDNNDDDDDDDNNNLLKG